jgi:hypothetical protein
MGSMPLDLKDCSVKQKQEKTKKKRFFLLLLLGFAFSSRPRY